MISSAMPNYAIESSFKKFDSQHLEKLGLNDRKLSTLLPIDDLNEAEFIKVQKRQLGYLKSMAVALRGP